MNLALLLLGPDTLYKSRRYFIVIGCLLTLIGLSIVIDASDTVTLISLEAFGWVIVVIGLARMAFSIMSGGGGAPSFYNFQGVLFVILGFAIADFPHQSENAIPWMFAIVMLMNGFYQSFSSLIIRYPNWGWFLVSGIAHLIVGGLLLFEWKHVVYWVVPLFLGAGITLMGLTILRTTLRLGRYLKGSQAGASEASVRYFLDFHVPGRFRRNYPMADPVEPPDVSSTHGDLLVHIWTPTTVAKSQVNPNIISRYVMAQDNDGKFAVGHSALEMEPDVYISHCDGDPTAFDTGDEVWKTLRSKDAPGIFISSFKEEISSYVLPSASIRFRNFNAEQLRTFWAMYRSVDCYNFTNRNCSVVVALALEAALVGTFRKGKRLRRILYLLTSKDLWVAHFIRWKAREAVWTPGLMLEYALALQRVVEE